MPAKTRSVLIEDTTNSYLQLMSSSSRSVPALCFFVQAPGQKHWAFRQYIMFPSQIGLWAKQPAFGQNNRPSGKTIDLWAKQSTFGQNNRPSGKTIHLRTTQPSNYANDKRKEKTSPKKKKEKKTNRPSGKTIGLRAK